MVRFCLSANEVLNKVRVRIALTYLLNRADALGLSIARSEPSYRNYFSIIVGYSGLHGKPSRDKSSHRMADEDFQHAGFWLVGKILASADCRKIQAGTGQVWLV